MVCIRRRLAIAMMAVVCCAGCGNTDDLLNRVAIEVSVQIGDSEVGDGSLVLRPQPGVKCPLIRIPVSNGVGYLSESEGPVPGEYRATFRPGQVAESLSQQLTETGRVAPKAAGRASVTGGPARVKSVLMPKGDMEMTVPDSNPAVVTITFEPA